MTSIFLLENNKSMNLGKLFECLMFCFAVKLGTDDLRSAFLKEVNKLILCDEEKEKKQNICVRCYRFKFYPRPQLVTHKQTGFPVPVAIYG